MVQLIAIVLTEGGVKSPDGLIVMPGQFVDQLTPLTDEAIWNGPAFTTHAGFGVTAILTGLRLGDGLGLGLGEGDAITH